MFDQLLKKIIQGLGVAAVIIGILLAWDQLTVNYAKASEVKQNSEHIYLLTDAIKTLVKESTKTRLLVQLDLANQRLYELEKKYYGSKIMSDQVKRFHNRLIEDKKDIQRRLDE